MHKAREGLFALNEAIVYDIFMTILNGPKALIFIAPPGAGKSTQAEIFSRVFNMSHLDSSKTLQEALSAMDPNDPIAIKAKSDYDSGRLMDPELVASIIFRKVKELREQDRSIVFSGSFRTLYEAEHGLPLLESLFGKDNIHIFSISISEEETVTRSLGRRVCEKEKHAIPDYPSFRNKTECPYDGSRLIRRSTDSAEVARNRFHIFMRDSEPVLKYLKDHKYEIVEIPGSGSIDEVTFSILSHLQLHSL